MLQLAPCLSTIDLAQDIPILVQNGVEMVTINDNDLFLDASDERLLEIRKIFEDVGIEIHSVHAPSSKSLTSSDSRLRSQSLEKFSRLIRQLSIARVGIMVHHGGTVEDDNHQSSAFSMVLDSLGHLVKVAEENKVVLALENDSYRDGYPRGFCSNSQTILEILDNIDSPWLKACFDTGHAHINEGMQETIKDAVRNLGDRIVTIHMQDNDGFGDLHLQPGYGTINW
ncbi:MAG: sugar phosphate isomerase/epimerase, partial [Candidatus Latescibacteria bacterium]|nr:sugar phosphate isomerase/epimerase [Candidatus Latescibacterota bacterium]